jgi:hypothetical protein
MKDMDPFDRYNLNARRGGTDSAAVVAVVTTLAGTAPVPNTESAKAAALKLPPHRPPLIPALPLHELTGAQLFSPFDNIIVPSPPAGGIGESNSRLLDGSGSSLVPPLALGDRKNSSQGSSSGSNSGPMSPGSPLPASVVVSAPQPLLDRERKGTGTSGLVISSDATSSSLGNMLMETSGLTRLILPASPNAASASAHTGFASSPMGSSLPSSNPNNTLSLSPSAATVAAAAAAKRSPTSGSGGPPSWGRAISMPVRGPSPATSHMLSVPLDQNSLHSPSLSSTLSPSRHVRVDLSQRSNNSNNNSNRLRPTTSSHEDSSAVSRRSRASTIDYNNNSSNLASNNNNNHKQRQRQRHTNDDDEEADEDGVDGNDTDRGGEVDKELFQALGALGLAEKVMGRSAANAAAAALASDTERIVVHTGSGRSKFFDFQGAIDRERSRSRNDGNNNTSGSNDSAPTTNGSLDNLNTTMNSNLITPNGISSSPSMGNNSPMMTRPGLSRASSLVQGGGRESPAAAALRRHIPVREKERDDNFDDVEASETDAEFGGVNGNNTGSGATTSLRIHPDSPAHRRPSGVGRAASIIAATNIDGHSPPERGRLHMRKPPSIGTGPSWQPSISIGTGSTAMVHARRPSLSQQYGSTASSASGGTAAPSTPKNSSSSSAAVTAATSSIRHKRGNSADLYSFKEPLSAGLGSPGPGGTTPLSTFGPTTAGDGSGLSSMSANNNSGINSGISSMSAASSAHSGHDHRSNGGAMTSSPHGTLKRVISITPTTSTPVQAAMQTMPGLLRVTSTPVNHSNNNAGHRPALSASASQRQRQSSITNAL